MSLKLYSSDSKLLMRGSPPSSTMSAVYTMESQAEQDLRDAGLEIDTLAGGSRARPKVMNLGLINKNRSKIKTPNSETKSKKKINSLEIKIPKIGNPQNCYSRRRSPASSAPSLSGRPAYRILNQSTLKLS